MPDNPPTRAELAEWKRLCATAADGPKWVPLYQRTLFLEFADHARTATLRLLAEVERDREMMQRVLHKLRVTGHVAGNKDFYSWLVEQLQARLGSATAGRWARDD